MSDPKLGAVHVMRVDGRNVRVVWNGASWVPHAAVNTGAAHADILGIGEMMLEPPADDNASDPKHLSEAATKSLISKKIKQDHGEQIARGGGHRKLGLGRAKGARVRRNDYGVERRSGPPFKVPDLDPAVWNYADRRTGWAMSVLAKRADEIAEKLPPAKHHPNPYRKGQQGLKDLLVFGLGKERIEFLHAFDGEARRALTEAAMGEGVLLTIDPRPESAQPQPPLGRKFSIERASIVLEALQSGCTQKVAAQRAGVTEGTLQKWIRIGELQANPLLESFVIAISESKWVAEWQRRNLLRQAAGLPPEPRPSVEDFPESGTPAIEDV